MGVRGARQLALNESAAIAPLYGLVLFMLVGIAGVGFDYARMMSLQSELQNAADQAALAGATQLDQITADAASGELGTCARAARAAQSYLANNTRFAEDGKSSSTTFGGAGEWVCDQSGAIKFWKDDQRGVPANEGEVRFIEVFVDPRSVTFALTPLIDLFSSGPMNGAAMAGLGTAICNTPPVMICNPREIDADGNPTGRDFDPSAYVGYGLKLITDDAGAPGNFGFLENGLGSGTKELAKALGYDTQPGNCVPGDGVDTEPGLKDVVFNAINTRFDLDISGENTCPGGDGNCSAAPVTRKDLVKNTTTASQCGFSSLPKSNGKQSWQQARAADRYLPPANRMLTAAERANVKVMGTPRDTCHAWSEAGNCSSPATDDYGVIGNKQWDRDAYFKANFGWEPDTWKAQPGLSAGMTRYEVYEWEVARTLSTAENQQQDSDGRYALATPVCRAKGDINRRKITAAVINCTAQGVSGSSVDVKVAHWVELFLVEPSVTRYTGDETSSDKLTDSNDVYVEIIRAVDVGDGNAGDIVRRDIPYLVH